ncbi:MAG: hypothetical protein QFX31_01115 [Methanothrix sp.]|nr:hypothetical protein [Methanothrix sp.]
MADTFPAEPFNCLQLEYSVSGATLGSPKDSEGFTFYRELEGTLTGDTLTISGVATAGCGWGATIDVEVSVDGQEPERFHQEKFPTNGLAEDPMRQSFSVTVPVPPGAGGASFMISLVGSYNAGDRGVVVKGRLSPSNGGTSAESVSDGQKSKPSKNLKLYKILQIYKQKIPSGLVGTGNRNNLLSWLPEGDKYDEFKCGAYQSRVLNLLDSLRFSDDPEERALLEDWDYGPIEALWGGHQAVVIYPKGSSWTDEGIVLDPWIKQSPKAYDVQSWGQYFSAGSFHGIRGSSVYETNPEYPTVGGTYVDPKNKKLTKEEMEFVKNLSEEKKKIYEKMSPDLRAAWVRGKMADKSKGGRAMGYSPLNLYLVDEVGRISGFPGGVPTYEIPNTTIRCLKLSDGTHWTELEYPLDASYTLVVEGSGDGDADLLLGFDGLGDRFAYRYRLQAEEGMRLELQTGYEVSAIYTESGSIAPEEIFEDDQEWLDSKPDVIAPQEFEVIADQEKLPGEEAIDLTGVWNCDDGGKYYIHQVDSTIWWYGESNPNTPYWSNVMHGNINGDTIYADWADVPKGGAMNSGTLTLRIESNNRITAVSKTGGFGGSVWTR